MSNEPTSTPGQKPKKPFYKRWWFIALAVFIVLGVIAQLGSDGKSTDATEETETTVAQEETQVEATTEETTEKATEPVETEPPTEAVPIEYRNALKSCQNYDKLIPMSKQGMLEQLTHEYGEQFALEAAEYAVENCGADWKENALRSAKQYQEQLAMSRDAIYEQLISEYGEQFTEEEAQYAVDNLPE